MREGSIKRSATRIAISALFVLGLVCSGRAQESDVSIQKTKAQAKRCTSASVEGTYSFSASGTITASPIPAIPNGPYAIIGMATFNADGTVGLTTTESFNGNIVPSGTFTGIYTINADCTGSVQTNVGGTFSLVLTDKGKGFYFLQTNTGTVISGTAKRQ